MMGQNAFAFYLQFLYVCLSLVLLENALPSFAVKDLKLEQTG